MEEKLKQLADKLGIATTYSDAGLAKKEYEIPDSTIRFIAERLGYKAGNLGEVEKSLADFDKKRWQRTLENIYVVEQGNIHIDAVVPNDQIQTYFALQVENADTGISSAVTFEIHPTGETSTIGKTIYAKMLLTITSELPVGYYNITFTVGDKSYKSKLAVPPKECYENDALKDGKTWGYAIQLYALKSEHNWGVGDFSDLQRFIEICSRCGADIIGVNPLNVLVHTYPENASPYSSISRLFLNPIYIDVEAVPEFKPEDKEEVKDKLEEVRVSELIRYEEVYPLKIAVLEKLYGRFMADLTSERQREFHAFVEAQGEDLHRLALFQTLYDIKSTYRFGGWKGWEDEFQNPNTPEVRKFAEEYADKIRFFKFLQFEAFRQFKLVENKIKECGLKIGLYRDLAVGVCKDSAELWSDHDLFIKDLGAGAPPDAIFTAGQKWGLGAFNPYVLKERCYEPFIKILRANMQGAGALRMDHVMWLTRLYMIPDKEDSLGTYVMYNLKDMLNIVAIESWRNKCQIVGESIGNVPDGFIEQLEAKNVYALSVLWEERKDFGWGDFKAPWEYRTKSFMSVGTHDMPPLRMWWFGYDIALKYDLQMMTEAEKTDAYHKREQDRWKLLHALDTNGCWPEDNLRKGDYLYGEAYPEGIEEAVHTFAARTNAKVFLAQLEDILHVEKLQNLPGTDIDKYPNWRRKLPVALEKLETDIAYIRNIKAIHKAR